MFMLCCFSKVVNNELWDRVYHVFEVDGAKNYTVDFIFHPVFRSFRDKGYTWSAVPFPEYLISKCGFEVSKYVDKELI